MFTLKSRNKNVAKWTSKIYVLNIKRYFYAVDMSRDVKSLWNKIVEMTMIKLIVLNFEKNI